MTRGQRRVGITRDSSRGVGLRGGGGLLLEVVVAHAGKELAGLVARGGRAGRGGEGGGDLVAELVESRVKRVINLPLPGSGGRAEPQVESAHEVQELTEGNVRALLDLR